MEEGISKEEDTVRKERNGREKQKKQKRQKKKKQLRENVFVSSLEFNVF